MKASPRVLLVHPDLSRLGGIETYISKILRHATVPTDSFTLGRRPGERGFCRMIWRLVGDYLRFIRVMRSERYPVVHLNPSMALRGFFREGLFARLAHLLGARTVVFFHGWQSDFAAQLTRRGTFLFRLLYGRVDAFIVLASPFAATLRSWGVDRPIHQEVTVIEDQRLDGFDVDQVTTERLAARPWRVLFLSRVFRAKGIFETVEAVLLLARQGVPIRLSVIGDGEDLEAVRKLAATAPETVQCLGHISLEAVPTEMLKANILCLPTRHGEGLPNVLVEAMAFGLPAVTCAVGGIADFFRDGKHGVLLDDTSPESIAKALRQILDDEDGYRAMALTNHRYACEHFLASGAAERLAAVYRGLVADKE